MGSIRPLITIAILAGVGAYLFVEINKGPAPSRAASNSANQAPEGVPPLTGTKGTTLAADNAAPTWPSSAPPAAATPSAAGAPAAKTLAKDNMPAVPAIPELPPLPSINDPAPPATQTTSPPPLPNDLPGNNPVARYPDQPGQTPSGTAPKDATT